MYFPVENDRTIHGRLKAEMGERVIDKITKLLRRTSAT